MLFVVIGLHIAIVPQDSSLLATATIAIIACLAVCWTSVYLPLTALSMVGALKADRLGLTNLLTWGGLHGGLAVAMAMSLPDGPEKAECMNVEEISSVVVDTVFSFIETSRLRVNQKQSVRERENG